jgi:two-component system sensor histidine kinase BaeS
VVVGSVRLGFGASQGPSTIQTVAWTWILVAAVAAIVVAILVAWFVSRRISRPLVRLSDAARAFAAGDRAARASAQDAAAPGELGDIARAFDETADAVVQSERARRQMSADVAHELRTPLAALQAGLEELRDGFVPADAERLASLHEQSVRLGRIVGDLAELSAAESAALGLRRSRVDLAEVAGDAVDVARPALDAAGLTVSTSLASDVMVNADSDRLHQAVGNLLGNAARYCRFGDAVAVTVASEDRSGVIVVSDTGPGIAPDDLPRVFDRMWRARSSQSVAGSGIGLAIVRELVMAHGGTVDVQSDGHSGTTFTLRLPLAD